jgi:hypothetical protein
MASDTFKKIFIGLVLITLFSFLMINFAIDMSSEYDISDEELTEGAIGASEYNTYLSDFEEDTEDLRESFEDGAVVDVDTVIGVSAVLGNFVKMMFTPFNLLAQIAENVLHVPPTFTLVLLGILIFSIVLAIWSIIRKGD